MERFVNGEIQQTRQAMGKRAADVVVGFANSIFEGTPLTVVAHAAKTASLSDEDKKLSRKVAGPGGAIMGNLFNSYMQGLVLQSYIVAMRLAIVLIWLAFLAPLFIAAVYDGLMLRNVKMSEFGSLRPATFTLAGMVVIPVIALPLLYLVLPFSLSPLLAPAWAAFVAMPLSILVSNSQPIFGR